MSIERSRAIRRVSWLKVTNVSGTIPTPIMRIRYDTSKMVPETSVIFNQITRLRALEHFIKFTRRETIII
jgi:hypothetical protein